MTLPKFGHRLTQPPPSFLWDSLLVISPWINFFCLVLKTFPNPFRRFVSCHTSLHEHQPCLPFSNLKKVCYLGGLKAGVWMHLTKTKTLAGCQQEENHSSGCPVWWDFKSPDLSASKRKEPVRPFVPLAGRRTFDISRESACNPPPPPCLQSHGASGGNTGLAMNCPAQTLWILRITKCGGKKSASTKNTASREG